MRNYWVNAHQQRRRKLDKSQEVSHSFIVQFSTKSSHKAVDISGIGHFAD